MATTTKTLLDLTAEDLMCRDVVTVPRWVSLRAAARLLRQARVSGAPVVDEQGRCVGVLSAADFLRWAEDGASGADDVQAGACCYQERGRLLNGQEAVICTLALDSCPLQAVQPATGGRHVAVCLQPQCVAGEWQQVVESLPPRGVRRYMTADVASVGPRVPVTELARMMLDARVHRLFVLDEGGRPVGVVACSDVLAAVAREGPRWVEAHRVGGGPAGPPDPARPVPALAGAGVN